MTMKTPNCLRKVVNEMAEGMHRLGILDVSTFQKITACEPDGALLPIADTIMGEVRGPVT